MQELVLEKHNFDDAKKQLKEFSDNAHVNPTLTKVDTESGLFGLFQHKVTGTELNELTTQIQKYLIDLNSFNSQIIKQIGTVYRTFESLDTEYIQGIIIAIKSAEENTQKIQNTQDDIKKTISEQKKIIEVLNKFKGKLEKLKQLEFIDDITDELKSKQVELAEKISEIIVQLNNDKDKIQESVSALEKRVFTIDEIICQSEKRIIEQENVSRCLQEKIKDIEMSVEKNNQNNKKKMNIMYFLVGLSLCISVIEFVFLLLR